MKVILPCGGRSSRFPDVPPKWMLPSTDGRPMIVHAVEKLAFDPDDLIVTILREHDEKYDALAGIRNAFGRPIEVVVLEEPTVSQPETITRTLRLTGLNEPFLVKDSDNRFALPAIDQPYNYVSGASLNDFDQINPRNKSYVQVDDSGVITAIREKEVISDLFSVGGYFFRSPAQYIDVYDRLCGERAAWQRELYTSDIIGTMILEGEPFKIRQVANYEDWGTLKEWQRNLQNQGAYFIQLDGFLFEHGGLYFAPRFEEVAANPEAIEITRELVAGGHKVIFISIRPEDMRELTLAQLAAVGLPGDDIIFDMPVGRYGLVSAPHPTVPFTTARGLELAPTDPRLAMKMRYED